MKSRIVLKKRTQAEWLVGVLILFPFLFGLLNELLRLPWSIRYLMDVAWLVLLALMAVNGSRLRNVKSLAIGTLLFLGYTLVVYLLQYQTILYYLWGFRNNFRMYVAFFACAAFLTPEDADSYLSLFDKLFWVNLPVCLIQFFGYGLSQDYLGGIFGTAFTNGYTNIFLVIIMTRSVVLYLEKKESTWMCACKCVAIFLVAALAELKYFFVEAALIIAMAMVITRFTWRKFWVVVGGLLAIIIGIQLLAIIFPEFVGWFSLKTMLESATTDKGYTYSGDLNRLTAIPRINELWLTEWWERLFGLGLGNCDTASYDLLNTPFYVANGDMHYTWMSYSFMYLECGWIGLLFFFGFFGLVFLRAWMMSKDKIGNMGTYSRMVMIVSALCVPMAVYNGSLRTEAGYMIYFFLALPFVYQKGNQKPEEKYNTETKEGVEWIGAL